ncbi:MAG: hypothetical protein F6K44_29400, partial [Moorea sp. SIO3E2]|nr:hypothetical protein [Moorena sp. SIO3E2]
YVVRVAWPFGQGLRLFTLGVSVEYSNPKLIVIIFDPNFPTPDSRLPTPDSRLPTPYSLFPIPYSIFLISFSGSSQPNECSGREWN